METSTKKKKVSDMTAEELEQLIKRTIHEVLDPDYGLDLRPEIEEELKETMKQKERGEGIPLEEVKKHLGIQ